MNLPKKPEKKDTVALYPDADYPMGYNQGRSDMDTYHTAVLEALADEGEIDKLLRKQVGSVTKIFSTYIKEALCG